MRDDDQDDSYEDEDFADAIIATFQNVKIDMLPTKPDHDGGLWSDNGTLKIG